MAGIYVYSDKVSLAGELISFANEAGQEAYVIALTEATAEQLKGFGAQEVIILKGDSTVAENYSQAIAKLLVKKGADLFLVGATPRGRDIAARTAGYLDCGMVSDVSALNYANGKIMTEKMAYGGTVIQSESLQGLSVVTVAAGKFEAHAGGTSSIVTIDAAVDSRVRLVQTAVICHEGADLSAAEKVICVGLGMDKEEDMQIAKDLAAVLGAEIGCTRGIAEERHWLPVEQYIGISGAVIKPQLYISMGVSGQIQHLVGVRDAKIIVAIDTNEKAPIFKAAEYGIVGNMYEIIPLLTKALKNAQ